MVLTTNNQGVAALASRMTKPAVIVAPRSNTTRLEDFEIQRKLGKLGQRQFQHLQALTGVSAWCSTVRRLA